jgi:hypothetical protein
MGTHSFYSTGEFKAAILLVWMVLTLLGTAVLITPFVLNEKRNRATDAGMRGDHKSKVAVGIPVARHPPHRPVLALLTHTVPALDSGGEANGGVGV